MYAFAVSPQTSLTSQYLTKTNTLSRNAQLASSKNALQSEKNILRAEVHKSSGKIVVLHEHMIIH